MVACKMIDVLNKDCFHVHTYRCGHAEIVSDEEYVKAALAIGATGIWFMDHAPFPGDPFKNRMKHSELNEYLSALANLKERYRGQINVHIGLEIEYFPSFDQNGYYQQLRDRTDIEILLLGQHMAETDDGYTFSWDKERLNRGEYIALGNAQIRGMESGYFDIVAHPDRIFRRQKKWSEGMQAISGHIIQTAREYKIPLEQNEASKKEKYHYWNEFWNQATGVQMIHGLDAHSIAEIRLISTSP